MRVKRSSGNGGDDAPDDTTGDESDDAAPTGPQMEPREIGTLSRIDGDGVQVVDTSSLGPAGELTRERLDAAGLEFQNAHDDKQESQRSWPGKTVSWSPS